MSEPRPWHFNAMLNMTNSAMHNVLLILLHRPFVSEGHLHCASPSIPVNSFVVCAVAATKIVQLLRLYDQTFSVQHAPYLISYATYVAATIHVRIAAQRESGSEAHAGLSTCLSVFEKNQETNWAVRRARTVILNLMKRMNVTIPQENTIHGLDISKSISPRAIRGMSIGQSSIQRPTILDSNTESTFVIGDRPYDRIAPDIDMEAIIQSFIREQQSMNPTQSYIPSQGSLESDPMVPASSMSQSMSMPTVTAEGFDVGYAAQPWNMMDYQVGGSVEDMLFGFNGAGVDGIW